MSECTYRVQRTLDLIRTNIWK